MPLRLVLLADIGGEGLFLGVVDFLAAGFLAVAPHLDHVEADPDRLPVAALVSGREVADDAALDLPARGDHLDRLGHGEHAVGLDDQVTAEFGDALVVFRGGGRAEKQAGEKNEKEPAQAGHGRWHRPAPA